MYATTHNVGDLGFGLDFHVAFCLGFDVDFNHSIYMIWELKLKRLDHQNLNQNLHQNLKSKPGLLASNHKYKTCWGDDVDHYWILYSFSHYNLALISPIKNKKRVSSDY